MEGESGGPGISDNVSDTEIVAAVLRDLDEAAGRWEAVVAQAATITYSVDMGDVRAVADCDGKLIGLTLHPNVVTAYDHQELAGRLNQAFTALRDEAVEDYQARYGGTLH